MTGRPASPAQGFGFGVLVESHREGGDTTMLVGFANVGDRKKHWFGQVSL